MKFIDGNRYAYVVVPTTNLVFKQLQQKKSSWAKLNENWNKLAEYLFPTGFCESAKIILKITIQQVITNSFVFTIAMESVMICGHLNDKNKLDATSLANSLITTCGIMIGEGLGSASDTYFSQVYGSVTERKQMGVILQRSLLIISLIPFLLWPLFLNFETIFLLLGQDPIVAKLATDYLSYFSPGLLFAYHFTVINKFLQNQNLYTASIIAVLIGNVFNITSQYLTVQVYQLDIGASAICQGLSFLIMELVLIIYIVYSKVCVDTWNGWKREAFVNWTKFLMLGIPGAGSYVLDSLHFGIGTIVCGMLGPTSLGIYTVLYQVESCALVVPLGFGMAVIVHVGQALGANNPKRALTHFRTACVLTLLYITPFSIANFCLRTEIPKTISDDKDVIHGSKRLFGILAVINVLESLGYVCACALLGCGKQKMYLIFIIVSFFIIGQPIAISLALATYLGVEGFWIGILISMLLLLLSIFIYLNFQDWEMIAEETHDRIANVSSGKGSDDESKNISKCVDNDCSTTEIDSTSLIKKSNDKIFTDSQLKKAILIKSIIFIACITYLISGILFRIYVPPPESNVTSPNNTSIAAIE